MKTLKVGILGCANIAIRSLAPAFLKHPSYQLIGFAGREISNTKKVAKDFNCEAFTSYQALIDSSEIDIVYIPLPNGMHYEWVLKALKSGKHVICEKSLGCSFDEVSTMILEAKKSNKLLFENFQFRFHSQHQYVKEFISKNEIGEIRSFRASFGFPPFPEKENIRYVSTLGGGALLDAGAYTIKVVQFILGTDFQVAASSMSVSKDLNVDIYGGIFMQNQKGQFAQLSYGFDNYYQCNYEIWGSTGKITVNRAYTAGNTIVPTILLERQGTKEELILPVDDHFNNMLTFVENCIFNEDFEEENDQNLAQAFAIEQVRINAKKFIF
jgi:dTDP-3,4-didehydro-2,6-dideoxy-alpha-D-glucose 3-reductase